MNLNTAETRNESKSPKQQAFRKGRKIRKEWPRSGLGDQAKVQQSKVKKTDSRFKPNCVMKPLTAEFKFCTPLVFANYLSLKKSDIKHEKKISNIWLSIYEESFIIFAKIMQKNPVFWVP